MPATLERRRFRRAELDVEVAIRSIDPNSQTPPDSVITGYVKNVSLAGAYCYVKSPCTLQSGEQVTYSILVPSAQAHWFPFRRLFGKGWAVRVEPIPMGRRAGENPDHEQLLGLAVAFAPDSTALGAVQS